VITDQNLPRHTGPLFRMTGKILVLTAIDDELDTERAPEGVEVIYSGVGKVNAASAATLSLGVLRPSLVINYGTAGKINEQLRGLVEVAHVVQRDMMAMPAGAARTHAVLLRPRQAFLGPWRCDLRDRRQLRHIERSVAQRKQHRHRRHGIVRDCPCLPAPLYALARVQIHHRRC